jgi:hypothetical protein
MLDPMRIYRELVVVGPFRTKVPFVDGIIRISLDIDELAALAIDELPAADGAVRTDALGDMSAP